MGAVAWYGTQREWPMAAPLHCDGVPGLLRKTRVILDLPVLPADRRAAVLQRIGGEARLAQAWERW